MGVVSLQPSQLYLANRTSNFCNRSLALTQSSTIRYVHPGAFSHVCLHYQPSLFQRGGIESAHTRNLATGGVGIVLFVSAWIPVFVFDKLGRKTWLQLGLVGMAGAMIGITVSFYPHHFHYLN
jgi:Sugar (and other) transporter